MLFSGFFCSESPKGANDASTFQKKVCLSSWFVRSSVYIFKNAIIEWCHWSEWCFLSLASEYWIKKRDYILHYWYFVWPAYLLSYKMMWMRLSQHWISENCDVCAWSLHIYFKWPDKSYRVLTIWTLLVSEKEIIYTFLDQLAVECIFCLACICFVKCCPPEGLKGLGLPSLVHLYTLI